MVLTPKSFDTELDESLNCRVQKYRFLLEEFASGKAKWGKVNNVLH